MADVKRIDIQELSDEGYIAEANRRLFHPLGLALERSSGMDREYVWKVMLAAGKQVDDCEVDSIMEFVEAAGLDRPYLSGVWDCRDDPGGVNYGPDHEQLVARAAANIERLWTERQPERVAALGYMIQPVALVDP